MPKVQAAPPPDPTAHLPPSAKAAYEAAKRRAEAEEREALQKTGIAPGRVATPAGLMARAFMQWILDAHRPR